MIHHRFQITFPSVFLLCTVLTQAQVMLPSLPGDTISISARITSGLYRVQTSSISDTPYLIIQGDDIDLDFNQAVLDGRAAGQLPDEYAGVALHIKNCKNVTIRNVSIRGFKIAILAENVENLHILNSQLSYNYRPRLYSRWDRESLSDWLYYHHNEEDEWQQYGAAIYLKQCDGAIVRDVVCHQGMNGLLMVRCRNSFVYNNDIRFNSGLGIGLYRSTDNRILHNRLDWNARGYSHGQYARGQDSAAILLYEQSSRNTIAFNSGTHSGDGLFLWAGQSTMDSGQGGCDSNIIYRNDFSHSIANGIEVTFSANFMIGNILNDCRFGIWGGYSHHSLIRGNEIRQCESAIAIEHGRQIRIEDNEISDCTSGIRLWDRASQPPDWPYAQQLDVQGRDYLISRNTFTGIKNPYLITDTQNVLFESNTVVDFVSKDTLGHRLNPVPLHAPSWLEMDVVLPEPLTDGHSAFLTENTLRGLKYILVDEWGPYDFQSPRLALRKKEEGDGMETLHFDIYGPPGKWKLDAVRGCQMPDHATGRVPDSLKISCASDSLMREIRLIYLGQEIVTPFGDTLAGGTLYPFGYHASSVATTWSVSFFKYDSITHPLHHEVAFDSLLNQTPVTNHKEKLLAYRWWGSPGPDLPMDQFGIRATTSIQTEEGDFMLEAESDDGIRVWIDDRLILDRWDIHTPAVDRVPFHLLQGEHSVRVEYFEAGGLAVLDVNIRPLPAKSTP